MVPSRRVNSGSCLPNTGALRRPAVGRRRPPPAGTGHQQPRAPLPTVLPPSAGRFRSPSAASRLRYFVVLSPWGQPRATPKRILGPSAVSRRQATSGSVSTSTTRVCPPGASLQAVPIRRPPSTANAQSGRTHSARDDQAHSARVGHTHSPTPPTDSALRNSFHLQSVQVPSPRPQPLRLLPRPPTRSLRPAPGWRPPLQRPGRMTS